MTIAKKIAMAAGNNISKHGFASMSSEKQCEIARMGGKSIPSEERSFSRNHDLASNAGRKGGQLSRSGRH
jgi:general stress protein YciG